MVTIGFFMGWTKNYYSKSGQNSDAHVVIKDVHIILI